MNRGAVALLIGVLMTVPGLAAAKVSQQTLVVPGVGTVLYGISAPNDVQTHRMHPLVLVLHPGERAPYYGARFMTSIVVPALADLDAIMVAPDCAWRDWSDPTAERAVMALLQHVLAEYPIDRRRVLVTGYSMGGRGAWFMESHHGELFTAAIVMAGSARGEPLERLGMIPTYVIHSRADQTMPFDAAERTAMALVELGRPVKFEALDGLAHSEMGGYVDPLRGAGRWIADQWARKRPD